MDQTSTGHATPVGGFSVEFRLISRPAPDAFLTRRSLRG